MQGLYINTAVFSICNNLFFILKNNFGRSIIHAEPPIACIICYEFLVNMAVFLLLSLSCALYNNMPVYYSMMWNILWTQSVLKLGKPCFMLLSLEDYVASCKITTQTLKKGNTLRWTQGVTIRKTPSLYIIL